MHGWNVAYFVSLFRKRPYVFLLQLATAVNISAMDYYVAPNGSDDNPGTIDKPLSSIMTAQSAASAGDTVYLRGGTYYLDNSGITATNDRWAIVNEISKDEVSYIAYQGERPVFDFSAVKPSGLRVTAFLVKADHCVFEGFDVVGVQVTIPKGTVDIRNTQSECFRVDKGSGNRFERLAMHDGMGIGWYLTDGSSNKVIHCDAYNNKGLDAMSDENTDGFGAHPQSVTGTGNAFIGCRSWYNADDGFDLINAHAAVVISNCWAFYNGYDYESPDVRLANGNGIKAGGYGLSGNDYPKPVPCHVVERCLSAGNRAAGFYANHHPGRIDWINNTSIRNTRNYDMRCSSDNTRAGDGAGFNQYMKNNLGYDGKTEVSNLGSTNDNDVTFNYWTLPVTVDPTDFVSLDESMLLQPRQVNGELPIIEYGHLATGSELIDAGRDVGRPYKGLAPDLGASENDSYP